MLVRIYNRRTLIVFDSINNKIAFVNYNENQVKDRIRCCHNCSYLDSKESKCNMSFEKGIPYVELVYIMEGKTIKGMEFTWIYLSPSCSLLSKEYNLSIYLASLLKYNYKNEINIIK